MQQNDVSILGHLIDDPSTHSIMSTQLYFGRILSNHLYRTSEGDYFLSSASLGASATDARKSPFHEARERGGQFAAIRGAVVGDIIYDCSLVEVVPPIASSVFAHLVDHNKGIRNRVLEIAREVRNELVGLPVPVPPRDVPLEMKPSGPLPLCVIDIGHHPDAPGASGVLNGKKTNEFAFNKPLADMIAAKVKNARIEIIYRDSGDDAGRKGLPAKTNALKPNFVISLHANSSKPMSHGSEVLYYHTSVQGKKIAMILQREFLAKLGLRDRKIKPTTSSGRGGDQLAMTIAPIVLGEPFFIGNPTEFAAVAAKKDQLAEAYATAIDEYAATIANPAPSAVTARSVASYIDPAKTFDFETANLTKEQFLSRNKASLHGLIASINSKLTGIYGSTLSKLTAEDVWVITYIEAGMRNGKVDPDHIHSANEHGLLPLPENIRFWNGSDAPVWNKPMPVARNLEHFYLYLGHLKNKSVTGAPRHLYRSLFKIDKIAGNPVREAKLLAGVVHGYFYSGNYSDKTVPFDYLTSGYQNDTSLAKLMKPTKYVHAGKDLMVNREKNISTALALI